jgi:hypothetical protein
LESKWESSSFASLWQNYQFFGRFSVKNRQILEILPLSSCKLALTETNRSSLVGVMADSFSAANYPPNLKKFDAVHLSGY